MPGDGSHTAIYQALSHTGDLGMLVYGRDLPELFTHAAWAMFDLMSDATAIRPRQTVPITLDKALDWEDLLVHWLSELLYRYDTERFLCCGATFTTLEPPLLVATAQGEPLDPVRHPIDTEIKAVTYHQIAVEPHTQGWQARVIFDL